MRRVIISVGLLTKRASPATHQRYRLIHTTSSWSSPAKFYDNPADAVKDIPDGAKILVGGEQ